MTNAETRREAASPYGEWANAMDDLMSYRYLASRPHLIDRTHAEGLMELRPDLRTAAGTALAAPLAIAMLDVAGINIDRLWILALTQINVTLVDGAGEVDEVYLTGQVIKEARSQIFTEVRIHDAQDRDRAIGFGTANWSVIVPTPAGFSYPEPGSGVEDLQELPPLWQAYFGQRRPDGLIEVPGLNTAIGTDRLHHGPMLVVTETAALEAAAEAAGTDALEVEHLALTIVAPGRTGPFVAEPVFVAEGPRSIGCRVEFRDYGREKRLVATAFVRMRIAD
jgi:acyl-coenzyme A thioesterase PaaI-like protein